MPLSNLPFPAAAQGLVVLVGGGEFSFGETREIDEFLLARLPADRRTIAFLPTASGSTDYPRHFGDYVRTVAADVQTVNVPIYRPRDARRQKNVAMLRDSGMVYIGGGVTNPLCATLADTPALEALKAILERGGIVAAIGAAASSLGSVAPDSISAGAPMEGLSLLPGTAVLAGFDPGNDTPLRRLMASPAAALGIGIPPGAALSVGPNGEGEIVGHGTVAIVRKPAPAA